MRATIFCLHYLGGSTREWSRLEEALRPDVRLVPIDLPGFGDAAATPGYTVAEMAEHVTQSIIADGAQPFLIAGHSMGAKVAGAIARRAADGDAELNGLEGLLLVAGSPPTPEPMSDDQRKKMLGWFDGDDASSRAQAHEYVTSNSGPHLDDASLKLAEADVLRCNRAAWTAWLEKGSRENWGHRVGVLELPTLVIAGADDENLGPDAQRRLTLPHYKNVSLVALPNAKHLLPMECTSDLARLFSEHVRYIAYEKLIASTRVSSVTRDALVKRGEPDDAAYRPQALDAHGFGTLRAIVDRVLPQDGAVRIDIAARIDRDLAEATGDGWRFATLPADALAYRTGIATIDALATDRFGKAFTELPTGSQDELLRYVVDDDNLDVAPFSNAQLKKWFEELRADAVKAYTLHPRTLARIGYSGVANGGDGDPKSGFAVLGLGAREPWEPTAMVESAR